MQLGPIYPYIQGHLATHSLCCDRLVAGEEARFIELCGKTVGYDSSTPYRGEWEVSPGGPWVSP